MNDYSDYLNRPGKFDAEEKAWLTHPEIHDEYARVVNESIDKYDILSVCEWGCGTGEVANKLKAAQYAGIDNNELCIKAADQKYPHLHFVKGNIRELHANPHRFDLVISFSVLKHFGLNEWLDIFKRISDCGHYFIFNMPIASETQDNGTEFHHILKSKDELLNDISRIGFSCLDIIDTVPVEPIFICKRNKL